MRKLKAKLFLLLGLFLLSRSNLLSQSINACQENIVASNANYEKGQFDAAIEGLKDCIDPAKSETIRWQAHRILAMAYLAKGLNAEARKHAELMLEINPTYQPSYFKDPTELIRLLQGIVVIPRFSVGLAFTVGGNFTFPEVTAVYRPDNFAKNYQTLLSWQAGVLVGYRHNKHLGFSMGIIGNSKAYRQTYSYGGFDFRVDEQLQYLQVPLYSRWYLNPRSKLVLFADLGGYASLLARASNDFYRTNANGQTDRFDLNYDGISRKNRVDAGALLGTGVLYKFKGADLSAGVQYFRSFTNLTNEQTRYESPNLFFQYYYLEDNLNLNQLAISFHFNYHLNYKVIKKP